MNSPATPAPDGHAVPSPCISICRMDAAAGSIEEQAAGGLCVGCLRTLDEIVGWGTASDDRKRVIAQAIVRRGQR